ncbi:MAG TPA: carbon-nitrogen hydrolase family protein [Terriglobales bacterium]|nr:carbon-nitrogen hydrolase family protein [Terriglobales bacterium]
MVVNCHARSDFMNKLALAQFKSSSDKQENLRIALALIAQARQQHAKMLIFPEFLMAYSPENQSARELCQSAEGVDGEFVSSLKKAAMTNDMSVVATIYEKSNVSGRVYDTAVLILNNGDLGGSYRKLHLYDALGFKESAKFSPGQDIMQPAPTACGHVGLMICYDLRFPELARILALLGAEILVAPSGWVEGAMKIEHWRTMIRARAIENGCYVVAPNQVGHIYTGHSLVVDPFGRTVLDLEDREGLGVFDIDLAQVREIREKLPLLQNRRQDIYRRYLCSSAEPGG